LGILLISVWGEKKVKAGQELDAGGDAMRWARRAFHENQYSYEQIVQLAQSAPAGSDQLLFLP